MPPPLILSLISNRAYGGRVTVNPKIDRNHDIKWMSILSNDGHTFYMDRSLNRQISNNGKLLDVAKPLIEHEKAEYAEMRRLVDTFKREHGGKEPNDSQRQQIYLSAHKNHGTVAEEKWLKENGYSVPQWLAWCRGELSRLEKKKTKKTPPSEDVSLFPHGKNLGTTLRADGGRIGYDDGGSVDPENTVPIPDTSTPKLPTFNQSLTEYHPTIRDRIARTLLGDNPSLAREQFTQGLVGSRGLGNNQASLVDFTPAGMPLAMEEAVRARDPAAMALAVTPTAPGLKGLSSSLGREVSRAYHAIPVNEGLTKTIFQPKGPKAEELKAAGAAVPDYHELTPTSESAEHFYNSFKEAKETNPHGEAVHIYNPEEYENTRMFLTPDSKAGFALKGDDIVSVFKHPELEDTPQITRSMLDLATSEGGKRLDAFDTVLPELYSKSGFRAVARLPWNDEYAPANWNYERFNKYNQGRPDVVYMTHDPEHVLPYQRGEGRTVSDPDEAVRMQDEALKGNRPEDYIHLEGSPKTVNIPGQGRINVGPFPTARRLAREYMEETGLPYDPPRTYAKVDEQRASKIAQEFENMQHDYNNPETKSAYNAMAQETMAQWNKIKQSGLKVDFIEGKDPYEASPRLAVEDIKNNNHMWVFPTESGFGESNISAAERKNNPMLQDSGETISGKPALINDIFRIVHDYFGHAKEGIGFRADGEENAWRSHAAMYSPLARKAMTTETRGQNSWLNYGPHGEQNRIAKTPDTVFADQKIGLLPDWVSEEGRRDPGKDVTHPDWIDQRLITSKKHMNDPGDRLVDLDSLKNSGPAYEKNVNLTRSYPNMPLNVVNKANTDDMAEHFINHVKDNVLYLYDQVRPEIRERSKLWYEGARKIAENWSKEFGVKDSTVAGVMAALSPQTPWFTNVSLARRVLDINKKLRDLPMTSEMESTFSSINSLQKDRPIFDIMRGKTLEEVDKMKHIPSDERAVMKAMWTRLYDESHNSKDHLIVTPEGNFGDVNRTLNGRPANIKWSSLPMIAKAIQILDADGGRESNNWIMGFKHKIRNFYNNILVPNSNKGDVTIDTHAVAAGLLRPLTGNDIEVNHNFKNYTGKGNIGASGSDITGIRGTYPLYAEAYRRAAAERGTLPREMQSITWEAVRGLFPEDLKSDKLSKTVDGLWNKYRTGKASLDETRKAVLEAGGGIRDPDWSRSSIKPNETSQGTNLKGELPEPRLYGPATQTARPRVGTSRGIGVKKSGPSYYREAETADERNYLASGAVDDAFDKAGLAKLPPGPTRDRVVNLVGRTGTDPLDIYEKVIMEEAGASPKQKK